MNNEHDFQITPDTKIGELISNYSYLKEFLISLSPNYKNLDNPIVYKTMSKIATLNMISERGDFQVEDLIRILVNRIMEESDSLMGQE